MGDQLNVQQLREFLTTVGDRLSSPAVLVLLGGSGLSLLGNRRPTIDVDFDGEEFARDELRLLLEQIAAEMRIELEAVPLHRFIPLPPEVEKRHILVGTFGNLQVFVFDPYSIALSKLDRGFDSDIEDVVFLLRQGFLIILNMLNSMLADAVKQAVEYDLNPSQMLNRLGLAQEILAQSNQ